MPLQNIIRITKLYGCVLNSIVVNQPNVFISGTFSFFQINYYTFFMVMSIFSVLHLSNVW